MEADQRILSVLQEYAHEHPDDGRAHLHLALFLGTRPSSEANAERERELRTAIRLEPRLGQAQFQLGVLYAAAGNDPAAIAAWQQTVQLDPEDAEAHYRLALAFRREKQVGAADREMATGHTNPRAKR